VGARVPAGLGSPGFATRSASPAGGTSGSLNHQLARTVHCWVLCWFSIFIFFHTAMVYTAGLRTSLNHITLGRNTDGWGGLGLYVLWMAIVIAAWVLATPLTIRRPRLIHRVGRAAAGPIQNLFEHVDPRPGAYSEDEIAPHLSPNGKMPSTDEYEAMAAEDFATTGCGSSARSRIRRS
jgi:sulfoxide reductase catalytic subunit YedY